MLSVQNVSAKFFEEIIYVLLLRYVSVQDSEWYANCH